MSRVFRRAFDAAAGPAIDFCTTCLGPNPSAPLVVLLKTGQELPRCRRCGCVTNTDGQSLTRSATERPHFKVIYLDDPERVPGLQNP